MSLPLVWADGTFFPIRLVRPFQRPPLDPQHEMLSLRLEHVEGLQTVRLNGEILNRMSKVDGVEWLTLPERLPARNVITLDVDASERPSEAVEWGTIALVISTTGAAKKPAHTTGDTGLA